MFNYPLKIVQICLKNLASASLPVYKRKLLITLIVLCTTEISLPFRSSPTRDMALQNNQVNSTTYLNPKNIFCLDISNKKALILLFSRYAFTEHDYYPHYLINYYIPKKAIMPKIADHLVYGRRRQGDTFFSQSEAKLSPINPQGPPGLYSSLAIPQSFPSTNLITHRSTINKTQFKRGVFINNLGAFFFIKEGLFYAQQGHTQQFPQRAGHSTILYVEVPTCWSVAQQGHTQQSDMLGC